MLQFRIRRGKLIFYPDSVLGFPFKECIFEMYFDALISDFFLKV